MLTIRGSLHRDESVKIVFNQDPNRLGPRIDGIPQVVNPGCQILVCRVWVDGGQEGLWVERF